MDLSDYTTTDMLHNNQKLYIFNMAFSGSEHAGKHSLLLRRKIKDNSSVHRLWKTAIVDDPRTYRRGVT